MHSLNYKAVLFDFDGVIANTTSFDKRALWSFFESAGLDIPESDYKKDSWFTKSWKQILELLAKKYDFKIEQKDIENKVLKKERMLMSEGIEIDPSLESFLHGCGEKKIRIAIGSNSSKERILWALKHIGIDRYFLHDLHTTQKGYNIVSCNDIIHHKPDPEVWLTCADMLGVPIEECLIVEDGLPGLTGAKRCGAKGVYYHRWCRPEKACIEIAEKNVESFSELLI